MQEKDSDESAAPRTPAFGGLVAVDFETFYDSAAGYSLRVMTPHAYVNDPRFDPYLVSVVGETGEEYVGDPLRFDWRSIAGARIVMHNAGFDGMVVNRLIELGRIPEFDRELLDSADMCAFMCVPRSLAGACKALLGIDVSKAVRADMDGRTFESLDQFKREALLKYAADDSRLCLQLFRTYGDKWPQWERDVSKLNREATWRGVRIDVRAATEGLARLKAKKEESAAALPWTEEGHKAGSRPQFLSYVKDLGLPIPASVAKNDPGFMAWADRYKDKYPFIQARLDYASLGSHISRLEAMVAKADENDILRYESLYYGAHCLTGDHEVLTPSGWERLDAWTGGDILQWTPNGNLRSLPASANQFQNLEPEMVDVVAPYLRTRMTLGHTVPKWNGHKDELSPIKAERLLTKGTARVIWPIHGVCSDTGRLTPVQMRVLVAVQADGHFIPKLGSLRLGFNKPRKACRIRQLLTEAGIPFTYHSGDPKTSAAKFQFRVLKSSMPEWMGAHRKVFGPWLLDSSPEAKAAFCEELTFWDGCESYIVHQNGTQTPVRSYCSALLANTEWVRTMLHLSGWSTGLLSRKPPKQASHKWSYSTTFSRRRFAYVEPSEGHVSRVAPDPIVYCPTTETGWFLCRYKDTIFVTGNTGRCSGSAREGHESTGGKINLFNLPKGDDEGMTHGVDIRGLHVPRPGHGYMIYDYGQIEARVVQWLAGNTEFLARAAKENVYQVLAKMLGWYPQNKFSLKDDDKTCYALSKETFLGSGFGMGGSKFAQTCEKKRVPLPPLTKDRWVLDRRTKFVLRNIAHLDWTVPENEAKVSEVLSADAVIQSWRRANPQVVALWRSLEDALRDAAERHAPVHYFTLPSGRRKPYWKPHISMRPKIVYDAETGQPEQKVESSLSAYLRLGDKVPEHLHGGPLTENLVQATARDIMFHGALGVAKEAPQWHYMFNVYDEIVFEVPLCDTEAARKVIPELLVSGPMLAWARGLPLEVEGGPADKYTKHDDRWRKHSGMPG